MSRKAFRPTVITLATAYADQTVESEGNDDEEFVIPTQEELEALSAEEVEALHTEALSHFDTIYGDGKGLTDEQYTALGALTEGIERLGVEMSARQELAAQREADAAALAARVRGPEAEVAPEAGAEETLAVEDEGGSEVEAEAEAAAEPEVREPASIVASATATPTRIPLASVRARSPKAPSQPSGVEFSEGYAIDNGQPKTIKDVLFSNANDVAQGINVGIDFDDAADALEKRLASFPEHQYARANASNTHLRDQNSLAVIRKPFPEDRIIKSNDSRHVQAVLDRAVDEAQLPGGSLVASGGWCAPSEVLYDLIGEVESRDGLLSLPEVGVGRGGVSFTRGPDFADIYAQITGFSYTEANDIAGNYAVDVNGVGTNAAGSKPCYKIPCPPFVEYRLGLEGLCLTAGLLQQRGYPEVIARTIRGALIAHDHRVNGRMIAAMVAGSTAVSLAANQVGTAAPVLTAIELQVEHYRALRRMARDVTLEAVFPFWVRGAIRSDLSRRLGIDPRDGINVTDAEINAWFRDRGVNPQFVYNWQDIAATASTAFTAWPTSVQFLLYAAGTWVRGTSDVITIDTLYDSVLLGKNDYTALFTEEGVFTARRGQDSRVITVPITADGATAAGVDIAHNGSIIAGSLDIG